METIPLQKANDVQVPNTGSQPGVLNLLKCKCSRCRKGDMFQDSNPWHLKHTMKMNKECAVCKQPFDLEVGFYYGAGYVSYALTVALTVATLVAWYVLVGFSYQNNNFFYWIGFNAVLLVGLQPYIMRLARTIWLSFFVHYNKNWRVDPPVTPERTNKDQANNW